MRKHFWELRMILFDSSVDEKHVGFYKSKKKVKKAMRNKEAIPGAVSNGSFFYVKHSFED